MPIREHQGNYCAYFKENGKEKTIGYSIKKYSEEYARILAKLSSETKQRYKNYIVVAQDYAILKLYSHTYGYAECLIDIEDIEKVQKCKWNICKDTRETRDRIVVRSLDFGLIHRYLLDLTDDSLLVDHISRDTLDNRKSNLRIGDNSMNQRNKDIQSNNTSGIKGVRFNSSLKIWTATIANIEGKRISKSYSISKHGDKAKDLAIEWRTIKEKEYGYL